VRPVPISLLKGATIRSPDESPSRCAAAMVVVSIGLKRSMIDSRAPGRRRETRTVTSVRTPNAFA